MSIERTINERLADERRDTMPIAAQIRAIATDLNKIAGTYTIGSDNHARVFELYWRDQQLAAERLAAIAQQLGG